MIPFASRAAGALLAAAILALPIAAEAHRSWLLPSATVLSGKDPWVTVDAAVSNDLFFFEHNPLRLDGLGVTGPDGKAVSAQNQSTGRFRSTFDLHLAQPGTYKLAIVNQGVFASYKVNGQTKRWRGTAQRFATEVPADAQELNVVESIRRVEAFVTAGKPTTGVFAPTGVGLELAPDTHPNDLIAKSEARFRLLFDGKPAAGAKVELVRGGIRYRDRLGDVELTTDSDGWISITWPEPGMYWMEATMRGGKAALPQAKERRATYIVTLEVLPE
ncbi:DUF4198 domain-containing protein [Desertibaculum subflavum]|uniref:DUF4198 domain-containing protein n=1 Tax=Desertibaculum subflavum TaxID=2268458 RepID=UPI000E666C23